MTPLHLAADCTPLALDPWTVGPDAAAANIRAWIDAGCPSDGAAVIDADLLPGSARESLGDEDPYGKQADRAAEAAWWARVSAS